jgi:peptidyl-prolyl cis-trans isomerase D
MALLLSTKGTVMLQYLHDKFKGVFAYGIGILIALTFALLGVERYLFTEHLDASVANVNEEAITTREFEHLFERTRLQQQQLTGKLIVDSAKIQKLKTKLLDSLIEKRLLLQTAAQFGLTVSDNQVSSYIKSEIPAVRVEGKFSPARLNQLLRAYGYTVKGFRQDIHDELLIAQLQSSLEQSQFVLPHELISAYALGMEKRDIRYVLLEPEHFSAGLKVSDKDIGAYYHAHPAEFTADEKVSLAYLTLSYQTMLANTQVTTEEVHNYYVQNKLNFRSPAQWRVAHILLTAKDEKSLPATKQLAVGLYKKLQQGEDFATLAAQYSADVVTKKKGGELPWLRLGSLDKAVDTQLLQLDTGQLSQPFKTVHGFEIFKVLQKNPSVVKKFAAVQAQITQTLRQERAQQQFAQRSDELANLTFVNPTTLADAAKQLQLTIKTTPLFAKKNQNQDLSANPKVIQAAFSADVLLQGNNSDIIALDQTTALVLRVKQHQPKRLKSLAEVHDTIESHLRQQRLLARAQAYANTIVKNPTKADAMLKAKQLHWQTKLAVDRQSENLEPSLVKAVFEIPATRGANPAIHVAQLDKGSVALIEVSHFYPGQIENLSKPKVAAVARQVAQSYGLLDSQLLLAAVRARAQIVRRQKHPSQGREDYKT